MSKSSPQGTCVDTYGGGSPLTSLPKILFFGKNPKEGKQIEKKE
jgi:hypothetical protein